MYLNKEGEDDHLHFEPVIEMPDKIEVITGEEDDDVMFEHRAKLYRFQDKQWKERGLGNVKILRHRETGKCRLLMRREQVLKVIGKMNFYMANVIVYVILIELYVTFPDNHTSII